MTTPPDPSLITPRPPHERCLEILVMAEGAGARRRRGVHRPTQHTFEVQAAGQDKPRAVSVNGTGCGASVQLSLDYRGPDGVHEHNCDVCIVCDGLALWPRYQDDAAGRPTA